MHDKLVLGTVQFGLKYGINNSFGKPSEKDVFEILDEAAGQGLSILDTADAYGNSIDLIGQYHRHRNSSFKILSKFKNIQQGQLHNSILNSLELLRSESFEVYSFHSYSDFIKNDWIYEELQREKQLGLIKKIGISVYTNFELNDVINSDLIDVIQLPYNLLDNEIIRGNLLNVAKSKNKEVHVRSIFLQGLFFKDIQSLPENLSPLIPYLDKLKQICMEESLSIESLALSYALFNRNIDKVLIGVETKNQLIKNLDSIANNKLAFMKVNEYINVKEIELLNPSNWRMLQ